MAHPPVPDDARSHDATTEPPLTFDFVRKLPGGVLDDATYAEIETELDKANVECTAPDGRWLSLSERVAILAGLAKAAK